jgi:hypothetical protein
MIFSVSFARNHCLISGDIDYEQMMEESDEASARDEERFASRL